MKICEVRLSLYQEKRVFQSIYMRRGVRKLLRMDLVFGGAWRGQTVGNRACREAKIEEADGSSCRQEKSQSRSRIFMEVHTLEVEEKLSTIATLCWAQGEQHNAWKKHFFEVQTWRQVGGPAGAVMCETHD